MFAWHRLHRQPCVSDLKVHWHCVVTSLLLNTSAVRVQYCTSAYNTVRMYLYTGGKITPNYIIPCHVRRAKNIKSELDFPWPDVFQCSGE